MKLLGLTMLIMLITACNSGVKNNDPGDKSSDTISTSLYPGHRDSLVYYRAQRNNIKDKLEELKKDVPEEQELKEKWQETIKTLETKFEAFDRKMQHLEKSTEDTWHMLKSEADTVLKDLESSIDRAVSNKRNKKYDT